MIKQPKATQTKAKASKKKSAAKPRRKPDGGITALDRLRNEHAREVLELRRVIKLLMFWGDSEPTLSMLEGYWGQLSGHGIDKRRAFAATTRLVRALRSR